MVSFLSGIMPPQKHYHHASFPPVTGKLKPMSLPLQFQKQLVEKRKHYKREILDLVQANIQRAEREDEMEGIYLGPKEIKK